MEYSLQACFSWYSSIWKPPPKQRQAKEGCLEELAPESVVYGFINTGDPFSSSEPLEEPEPLLLLRLFGTNNNKNYCQGNKDWCLEASGFIFLPQLISVSTRASQTEQSLSTHLSSRPDNGEIWGVLVRGIVVIVNGVYCL